MVSSDEIIEFLSESFQDSVIGLCKDADSYCILYILTFKLNDIVGYLNENSYKYYNIVQYLKINSGGGYLLFIDKNRDRAEDDSI